MDITFKNVKKTYTLQNKPFTALDIESLQLESGKIIGLFGENGAGKSTLLKLLTGRILPSDGTILFSENREKGAVFYMIEEDFKNLNLPVKQILDIVSGYYPRYDKALEKKWLEHFGLPIKKNFQRLSKGQKGLVCSIAAMASGADVTILDETFVSLDVSTRKQLFDTILNQYMDSDRTFILTSHYANELAHLIERVWIMHNGKLVLNQSVDDLKSKAFEVTGDKKVVDSFIKNKQVLNSSEVGYQKKAYLLNAIGEGDAHYIKSNDMQVYPMTLDHLVMLIKEA